MKLHVLIVAVLVGCSVPEGEASSNAEDGGPESSSSGRGRAGSAGGNEGHDAGELGGRGGRGSDDAGAQAGSDAGAMEPDEVDEPEPCMPGEVTCVAGACVRCESETMAGSGAPSAGAAGGMAGAGAGGSAGSVAPPAERVLWTYEAPETRQFNSVAYVAYQRAFFTLTFGPCSERLGGDAPAMIDDLRTDRFEVNGGDLPAMLECARAYNGVPASDAVILIYAHIRKPNEALDSGIRSIDIGWKGTGGAFSAVKDNTVTAFKREVLKYSAVEKNGGTDVTASVRWSILGY